MQSELGGKTTRCPRCFRTGWAEVPIEGAGPTAQEPDPSSIPRLDWLEGVTFDDETTTASAGQKSERDLHGSNCNCRACRALRKGYARARKSGRTRGHRSKMLGRYVKKHGVTIAIVVFFAALLALAVAFSR